MGRRRGIMSERLKEELAKELGFYDVVQREGWGGSALKMRETWSSWPLKWRKDNWPANADLLTLTL